VRTVQGLGVLRDQVWSVLAEGGLWRRMHNAVRMCAWCGWDVCDVVCNQIASGVVWLPACANVTCHSEEALKPVATRCNRWITWRWCARRSSTTLRKDTSQTHGLRAHTCTHCRHSACMLGPYAGASGGGSRGVWLLVSYSRTQGVPLTRETRPSWWDTGRIPHDGLSHYERSPFHLAADNPHMDSPTGLACAKP
jgi:hypothetical protein